MEKFKHFIINEAAYDGNIGFQEMAMFYQKATDSEIKQMEKIIKNEDWDAFKNLIYKILRVKLK